jgi:hypothetical protein
LLIDWQAGVNKMTTSQTNGKYLLEARKEIL